MKDSEFYHRLDGIFSLSMWIMVGIVIGMFVGWNWAAAYSVLFCLWLAIMAAKLKRKALEREDIANDLAKRALEKLRIAQAMSISASAKEVEKHWNDASTMTNQCAQASRSAGVLEGMARQVLTGELIVTADGFKVREPDAPKAS